MHRLATATFLVACAAAPLAHADNWQTNGAPTFSYNHEATSGNQWTIPLAVGVTKTTLPVVQLPW